MKRFIGKRIDFFKKTADSGPDSPLYLSGVARSVEGHFVHLTDVRNKYGDEFGEMLFNFTTSDITSISVNEDGKK